MQFDVNDARMQIVDVAERLMLPDPDPPPLPADVGAIPFDESSVQSLSQVSRGRNHSSRASAYSAVRMQRLCPVSSMVPLVLPEAIQTWEAP